MTADELRQASGEMRRLAESATPGPWKRDRFFWKVGSTRGMPDEWWCSVEAPNGEIIACGPEEAPPSKPNTAHIAAWHPAVALAVADWLDVEALDCEELERQAALEVVRRTALGDDSDLYMRHFKIGAERNHARALAVARAFLGTTP